MGDNLYEIIFCVSAAQSHSFGLFDVGFFDDFRPPFLIILCAASSTWLPSPATLDSTVADGFRLGDVRGQLGST
jgi:hypothetical protein